MTKKGDTLVEVCVAIGIFSLVAVGVAAVMSSGTAGSESSLETVLTREEIDAQADAIRFIHESYMTVKNSSVDPKSDPYYILWKKITENAIKASDGITHYNPSNCADLYQAENENNIFRQKAFIMNIRELSNPDAAYIPSYNANFADKFTATLTYPRLLYGDNSDSDKLLYKTADSNLLRTEGLYVIAVKDGGTDIVINGDRTTKTVAFYDFYIRSCWYGTDAEHPTSISTVIRLYDVPNTKKGI